MGWTHSMRGVAFVLLVPKTLAEIFLEVARKVDGSTLVEQALAAEPAWLGQGPLHVLAFGKVAFPMFDGLQRAMGDDRLAGGLLVAPETRFPVDPRLPANVTGLVSDHPDPSERSVTAGRAARDFVAALSPSDRLIVLISGGGSSALALPAGDLSLEDKRGAAKAVARAGASIAELNAVRKHLSAIKGGQLALLTRAPTTVLALSDVVGNDPGTIASGPFSPDPSTFEKALALVQPLAGQIPAWALDHLRRGAAGELGETPKPGDPRLAHVDYRILAGPERVADEARRIVESERREASVLSTNTERSVPDLALAYGERARREIAAGGSPRVLIGNGEPTIVVTGQGRGGRATHLALMMAREISGLDGVAFLAAGTDDRDGSSDASGAVVDGATWERAKSSDLDPEGALSRCDSETPLKALGCLVRGPGTSNLLDLHLLAIGN
jgi:hydroxypyruvate reductase